MEPAKPEAQEKILFVDDEENILNSLRRLLMDEPYELLTANSGREGLETLKRNPDVGLIVSDQRMPEMSGVEFLMQSRELAPDALRMVLTGYADINAAVDAINKGGAYRYAAKPWKDDELIQIIREGVTRHALQLENKRLTGVVRQKNEELKKWNAELEYLVQQQTVDIQNRNKSLAALNDRLKRNFLDTILSFSQLLELRDKTARTHSRNVAEVSKNMARAMMLPAEEIEAVAIASLLHDIGKIGFSDSLLTQDYASMGPDGRSEYALHPVRGQMALDAIEDLRMAGVLIRHHHESYDGTGFPDKLKEQDIPLGARIISIADFFDNSLGRLQVRNAVDIALAAVRKELRKKLDPDLYPFLEVQVRETYPNVAPQTDAIELELNYRDLREGMVLAKEVRSGTGLLLLGRGVGLTSKNIQAINRYFQIDPPRGNIYVLVRR